MNFLHVAGFALTAAAGFGIARAQAPAPAPSASPSAATSDASGGGLALIGAVRAEAATAYHLKLTAYREPQTFLIRETRGEVCGHYVASGRFAGIVDFQRVGERAARARAHGHAVAESEPGARGVA